MIVGLIIIAGLGGLVGLFLRQLALVVRAEYREQCQQQSRACEQRSRPRAPVIRRSWP